MSIKVSLEHPPVSDALPHAGKVKVKVRFIYVVPQMPHMLPRWRCRNRADVHLGYSPSPRSSRTLACSHAAIHSHSLPF